jgi:hypothetical protein
MTEHELAVCAIFKNEGSYLAEWVNFHRMMGVEHFYLYDNHSTDDYASVIAEIDNGDITVVEWVRQPGQISAYNHCLYRHGEDCTWLAFIDLDEFLFCPDGQALPEFLADYLEFGGVGVNWVVFGSNGHLTKPAGNVTENYRLRGPLDVTIPYPHLAVRDAVSGRITGYMPLFAHIKSIVQPEAAEFCPNPHFVVYRKGFHCVGENRERIEGPFSRTVSVEKIRLNHYWSKSAQECVEKIAKGRADSAEFRALDEFELREKSLNAVFDDTIDRAIARSRQRLESGRPEEIPRK